MALPQRVESQQPVELLDGLGLQGERLQAARTVESNVLVKAGPGAGKTYLLVAHAAYLAQHGCGRVIVLTYTRNAAREVDRRVTELIGPQAARRVVVRTIHSHAFELLKVHGHRLRLGHPLRIVEPRDVEDVAKEVARELGQEVRADFARQLERLLRRRALRAEDRKDRTVVGRVLSRMRSQGQLTWESCLDLAIELLGQEADVAESVRYHDRYLLLDEAQDCDPAQLALIDQLVGGPNGRHLFVAMDPDQSLYAFRDADPERVLSWAQGYQPEVFELTENYRCKPRVTALARYVLQGKSSGVVDGGSAYLIRGTTRAKEASFVAREIGAQLAKGTAPERIAVLARRNNLLVEAEKALKAEAVSYRKPARGEFSGAEETVLAALELLEEWEAGRPPSAQTFRTLRQIFGFDDAAISELEWQALLGQVPHPAEGLEEAKWLQLVELRDQRLRLDELVPRVAETLGCQLAEPSALGTLAAQYRTLAQLLHRARQGPLSDGFTGQGVLVSSFHGSKGLEFDTVFILACEDGIIPDFRAESSPQALREERRALYVAMTRASSELWITCTGRSIPGGAKPSRFLPAPDSPLWTPTPSAGR